MPSTIPTPTDAQMKSEQKLYKQGYEWTGWAFDASEDADGILRDSIFMTRHRNGRTDYAEVYPDGSIK